MTFNPVCHKMNNLKKKMWATLQNLRKLLGAFICQLSDSTQTESIT